MDWKETREESKKNNLSYATRGLKRLKALKNRF